jgi:hypothetical protein
MTLYLLAVKPNCDRPLIPNLNSHRSTKDPTCDSKPITSKSFLEMLKEGFCNYWRRGVCKAGATPPARISVEGELRDDQHFAANIEQRAVHPALVVAKDAQIDNFVSQGLDLNLAVALSYSQQHQEPLTYLAHYFPVYGHTGMAYTL